MGSYDWADLLKQAEEAGLEYELQPPGPYHTEIVNTNLGKTQGGGEKIGVQHKILDGPRAGKSFWDNVNVPKVKENGEADNPKAAGFFFRKIANYGGSIDTLRAGGLDAVRQQFHGTRGTVDLQHRTHNGKTYHDIKSFRADIPGAAAPVAPPAPAPAPAPAPQPGPIAAEAAPATSGVPF